jgi:hypothetical protein
MNYPGPQPAPGSFFEHLFPDEPSAVDRLAALVEPDGEAARRVAEWKAHRQTQDTLDMLKRVNDLVEPFSLVRRALEQARHPSFDIVIDSHT